MDRRRVVRALGATAFALGLGAAGALLPPTAAAAPTAQPHSAAALNAVQAGLDAEATTAAVPLSVATWHVDAATNAVIVTATDTDAAKGFVRAAGVDASAVRIEQVAQTPQTFAPLVGGDAINNGTIRCSIGFSARNASGTTFVLTAGHCTRRGGTWRGANNVNIGPVSGTSFPGNDYGRITVTNTAAWQGSSQIRGTSSVLGSNVAAIGSQVCRSGSTTGFRCGVIQARNVTVNYGIDGVVSGLTQTSACAQPGDSGGPYVSNRQAQGLLSGGSGNCSVGGTTFYQEVREVLTAYGLTLVVG